MPDTNILLSLCDELDTTADTLLNGGVIINKQRRVINAESIVWNDKMNVDTKKRVYIFIML